LDWRKAKKTTNYTPGYTQAAINDPEPASKVLATSGAGILWAGSAVCGIFAATGKTPRIKVGGCVVELN